MQPISPRGYFEVLPHEISCLIIQKLPREDCINLRRVDKVFRTIVDESKILNTYSPTPIKTKVFPRKIFDMLLSDYRFSLCLIALKAFTKSRSSLDLVLNLLGMSFGSLLGFTTVTVINDKIFKNWLEGHSSWVMPVAVISICPIFTYIIFTASDDPLYSYVQGIAYAINSLFVFMFTFNSVNKKNSLECKLQKALLNRLDLSHVNPQNLKFIHASSDKFALRTARVVGCAILIFTNPIFASTGFCLTMAVAKGGYMYYQARKALLT